MPRKTPLTVLYTVFSALCIMLLTIAAAIAAPILVRPFYYLQIGPLGLEAATGLSNAVIREAYDQVMDYLVFGRAFGTGQLAYSAAGQAHFADCRALFILDFAVIGITAALLVLLAVCRALYRRRQNHLSQPQGGPGHLPVFWAAVLSCGLFAVLAVWGAVSFDSLFTAFHRVFFPGKTNWIFDPAQDAIITILPQRFFLHCALLIAGLIFAADLLFFVLDARYRRRATRDGLRWRTTRRR